MKFLEKDLEEIIFEASDKKLDEKGLDVFYKYDESNYKIHKKRQLQIGSYGIADLVTFERCLEFEYVKDRIIVRPALNVKVFELKKDAITVSTFFQALRYAKGIQRYLEFRCFSFDYNITIVLVGRHDLSLNSDVVYLNDLINDVKLYGYDYTVDGIEFKEITNYKLTKENFTKK